MIDMLVLQCSFKRLEFSNLFPSFSLGTLKIPHQKYFDGDGDVLNIRHPWETLPSSFSGMGFKVFDHRFDSLDSFYIEIKASPAKIMQGHNVFGSNDFYDCCMTLISLLFDIYPQLGDHLDFYSWQLGQIDITYFSSARNNRDALMFVNALQNISHGQTKSRDGYDGTAYFGAKNSRLKKIKVYLKKSEVLHAIKENAKQKNGEFLNSVYTPELMAFTEGMIRWEVSLFHRYFDRLDIDTHLRYLFKANVLSPQFLQHLWYMGTRDIFNSFKGQTMTIINDVEIQENLRLNYQRVSDKTGNVSYSAADSAFRTFLNIKRDGWLKTRSLMGGDTGNPRTFNHHVGMLVNVGLSRASLMYMTGSNDGANVIPFINFISVDFGMQYPADYQQPTPIHVRLEYNNSPKLKLVA